VAWGRPTRRGTPARPARRRGLPAPGLQRRVDKSHRRRPRHKTGEPLLLLPVQGGSARARLSAGRGRIFRGGEGNCIGAGSGRRQARASDQIAFGSVQRSQRVRARVLERAPAPAERKPAANREMVARARARVRGLVKEGVRRGEFRADLDTRLAVLAILGMSNAVANWYRNEEVAIERISGEFARFVIDGAKKRPKPRSRIREARRSAR